MGVQGCRDPWSDAPSVLSDFGREFNPTLAACLLTLVETLHSSSDEKAKCFLLFFSQPALPSCPVLLLRETTTRRATPDSSPATTTSTRQSPGRPSGPEPPSWATRFSTRAAAGETGTRETRATQTTGFWATTGQRTGCLESSAVSSPGRLQPMYRAILVADLAASLSSSFSIISLNIYFLI